MSKTRFLMLSMALLSTPALAIDITGPGQTVPKGQTGVLQTDVVCSSPGSVRLENGATLDLNGHVLDGCHVGGTSTARRMTVRGPGEIRDAGIGINSGTLRVFDVAIHDPPFNGIIGSGSGEDKPSTVRLTNVTITGSGWSGVQATRVVARNVSVSGSGVALESVGIVGWQSVDGRDVVVTGTNGDGIDSSVRVRLRDSQITGNTGVGIVARTIGIVNSTVTGSNPDLACYLKPLVRNSICGTSLNISFEQPWGVCSGD